MSNIKKDPKDHCIIKCDQMLGKKLLERAFEKALEAFEVGEVPIGCIITSKSHPLQILSTGRNRTNELKNGTRHAELEALDLLPSSFHTNKLSSHSELIIAVTIEPCIMCASLLRSLGVYKVFYGARNDRFGGCGSVFCAHTVKLPIPALSVIQVEDMIAPNVNLLRKFYLKENDRAPPEKKKQKTNRIFKEFK